MPPATAVPTVSPQCPHCLPENLSSLLASHPHTPAPRLPARGDCVRGPHTRTCARAHTHASWRGNSFLCFPASCPCLVLCLWSFCPSVWQGPGSVTLSDCSGSGKEGGRKGDHLAGMICPLDMGPTPCPWDECSSGGLSSAPGALERVAGPWVPCGLVGGQGDPCSWLLHQQTQAPPEASRLLPLPSAAPPRAMRPPHAHLLPNPCSGDLGPLAGVC